MALIRGRVAHYDLDHYFAPDIAAVQELVQSAAVAAHAPLALASLEP